MKIIHVTKKYPYALGGDGVVVANLETEQVKLGDTVTILTSNCDDIQTSNTIYKFGLKETSEALDTISLRRLFSLFLLIPRAFKVFALEKPDVVHTHSVEMAWAVSFAARYYKLPIVHTFHIVTFNAVSQSFLRRKSELFFLRHTKPQAITVLNPADMKDFINNGFKNTLYLPNGVNLKQWKSERNTARSKKFTFIAVGRLEKQKDFANLIKATALLKNKHSNYQVLIVGAGSQEAQLKSIISEYNLDSTVKLIGRKSTSELRTLYLKSDVYVLSSQWEGMPLTLLEAWAANLATICTSVNSVQFIASKTSLMVPPGDSDALAEAMSKLLSDPLLVKKLRIKSNRTVKQFDWAVINRTLKSIYDQ
jgi:glycosyltransferase involved in cell wall biosynthesis